MKAQSRVEITRLPLLGGALCLDFVNTIDPRHRPPRLEYLASYDALLEWAVHAGVLGAQVSADLAALAQERPAAARRVHARAIALREAMYETLAAATRGDHSQAPLATLNTELQHAMNAAALRPAPGGYHWGWTSAAQLDQMLWPVVRSAADLLTSPHLRRVALCDGEGCGWLFVDTSKAGRRRWCSMAICGNRAKARRHAQRTHGSAVG